ncbi:MAG: hypothetical protein ACI9ON_002639, partial [Limisphaerales bacterium]
RRSATAYLASVRKGHLLIMGSRKAFGLGLNIAL